MKIATVTLKGITPYSQSRAYGMDEPKLEKETHDAYEKRTWRKRLHVNERGYVFIPPMAWKNALSEAAKYNPRQIKGQGKATYTKNIEAGVLVMTQVELPIKAEDVPGEWYFVPADGRRGSGKRVHKCFPVIREWGGVVEFHILDEKLTPEIFTSTLTDAGQFIGIGRFRPRNNGYYGRFEVGSVTWSL